MSYTYTYADGTKWVIDNSGDIDQLRVDGSDNVFDTGNSLSVSIGTSNTSFNVSSQTLTNATYKTAGSLSGTNVSFERDAYFATSEFVRCTESFTNTGTGSVTLTVTLSDDAYYNSNTSVSSSSSGNATIETQDKWYVVKSGDASYGHLISGNGGQADSSSFNTDKSTSVFTITLAPGETKTLLHFYTAGENQAEIETTLTKLATLPSEALSGLSDADLANVDNFNISVTSNTSTVLQDGSLNLTLTGNNAINGTGNSADNDLIGNAKANTLRGLAGNDFLDGRGGTDTMIGGEGNDTYRVNVAGDKVVENANSGNDTIESFISYGLANQPYIENVTLLGNGNLNVAGNAANNVLRGNAGINTLIGKGGNDTYYIQNVNDKVIEVANAGQDTVFSTVSYTLTSNVENLTLMNGGSHNTVGKGNALNNILNGNALNNVLYGYGGHDILNGNNGNDTMYGGAGNDTYYVNAIGDKAFEYVSETNKNNAGGVDKVMSSIDYHLGSFVENLTLIGNQNISGYGNALNNTIVGNSGSNYLDGGAGADILQGGQGNDTYKINTGNDSVIETADAGIDTAKVNITNYTLTNNVENADLLEKGVNLTGNTENNAIYGNKANNHISGLAGDDYIQGGAGNDVLNGGDGNDTLLGDTGEVSTSVSSTSKVINDNEVFLNVSTLEMDTGKTQITGTISTIDYSQKTNILYVLDTSGSMDDTFNGNDVGDTNGDGNANTVMDAEIASYAKMTQLIADSGFGDNMNVIVIPFNGSASVAYSGNLLADTNNNGVLDVVDSLTQLDASGGTDYTSAIELANTQLSYSASDKNIVFFASDGEPNDDDYLDEALPTLRSYSVNGTTIRATGIGSDSDEEVLDILDDGISNDSAQIVTDPSQLDASFLYDELGEQLESAWIEIYRNGELVDLIGADEFEITPLGIQFTSSDIQLSSSGSDEFTTKLVLGGDKTYTISTDSEIEIKPFVSNDTLIGGAGNDILDGGYGADDMRGGTGDDTYYVNHAADKITEASGEGSDTVYSSINYTLGNNLEKLTLLGSNNINATGNALDNVITGNNGNNILNGGAGDDELIGGLGNDTYHINSNDDVVTEQENAGIDTVVSTINITLSGNSSYHISSSYSSYSGYRLYNVENARLANGSIATELTGSDQNNRLVGNEKANTITGNDGNDYLDGLGGADTMYGGAGNDVYVVDNANDVTDETGSDDIDDGGIDRVVSSINTTLSNYIENLTLAGGAVSGTGNNLNNAIWGNQQNNIINGGLGGDTMYGGKGNDKYYVNTVLDTVVENANQGYDTAYSTATYKLSANVEQLVLQGNHDISGAGNTLANRIIGNSGDNYLLGYWGNDVLAGNTGADKLYGGVGNDKLYGGEGNDLLNGQSGDDVMNGGMGNDAYYVDSAKDSITEIANQGNDIVNSYINYTLGANIERLTLLGSATNANGNTLNNVLQGNARDNTLNGYAGHDKLIGGDGQDKLIAGDGNDTLLGQSGSDKLFGQSGNDVLAGGDGADYLYAGAGNDKLYGGDGNDLLNGQSGNDVMNGGMGNDTYYVDSAQDSISEVANQGNDIVNSYINYTLGANIERLTLLGNATNANGNTLNNVLQGNAHNNTLNGNAGHDKLIGGDGHDKLIAGDGNDTLLGQAGTDKLFGQLGNDVLAGGDGQDSLYGGNGNDKLYGGNGNDLLNGQSGNDVINAGAGNDTLRGGTGRDELTGGAGNDIFVYDYANDSTLSLSDLITDFTSGADRINLSAIDADTTQSGNQAFDFIGSAAFTDAGQLRFAGGVLYANTDSDSAAEMAIRMDHITQMVQTDFIV